MRFFACFALTVFQCTSSARTAVSQASRAAPFKSIEETWANHQDGVATKDIDKIMRGYTEQSEIKMWMEPHKKYWIVSGLDEISKFNSFGFLDSGRSPVERFAITDDRQTWTVWDQLGQTEIATDTFIYDENFKIIRQYVYTVAFPKDGDAAEVPQMYSPPIGVFGYPTPGFGPTQDAWNTHSAAWRSQNIEDILTDYTEASILRVFNQHDAEPIEFKGLAGIRQAFTGVLAALAGVTDYEDILEEVDHDHQVVDWVWQAPSRGYKQTHETVIFDEDLKIKRQNIVIRKYDR